nr:MAG TPA: hypothetical protein [Caudoviricetes sp.]
MTILTGYGGDKETGVMYISAEFDFTVMINADGTPKIWQGEE